MLQHAICGRQHFCCSLQRCSKVLHFVDHHATRPWPWRHCTAGMPRGRGGPRVRLMQMTHSECASPRRTGCCGRGIIARTVISFIPRASAWCHPCNVNCIYSGTALAINFLWQSWKNWKAEALSWLFSSFCLHVPTMLPKGWWSWSGNQKRRSLWSSENGFLILLIPLTTPQFAIKWKLGRWSCKQKWKN